MAGHEKDPAKRAAKRGTGSWEPFLPGNEAALQHGARSERALAPLAAAIEAEARAGEDWPPHLESPRYASEVAGWAWAEAVCERLRVFLAESDPLDWLAETDTTDETVQVREQGTRRRSQTRRQQSALEQLRRWEDMAGRRRQALGLNPVSAARLARDLSAARMTAPGHDLARAIADLGELGERSEGSAAEIEGEGAADA